MKPVFLACIALLVCASCSVQKPSTGAGTTSTATGDTRTTRVEYLNDQAYKLTEWASDKSYGYEAANPIKVGSKDGSGPLNERRFLNGLLGPNGEPIEYYRAGSCCGFKTPNGFGGMGLLDRYKVYWGTTDTVILYINMYDMGDLKIPVGLTAKKE